MIIIINRVFLYNCTSVLSHYSEQKLRHLLIPSAMMRVNRFNPLPLNFDSQNISFKMVTPCMVVDIAQR